MNRMPLSLSKKIHIITAGIISLLAQGILLIPSRLEFILGYLPSWGGVAIGAAPRREAGFLLSSVITILATYGIFRNASSAEGQLIEKGRPPSIFLPDPATNVNALNEQIASLTHQLSAEKRRTLQLTFLNELSQQLEAELDRMLQIPGDKATLVQLTDRAFRAKSAVRIAEQFTHILDNVRGPEQEIHADLHGSHLRVESEIAASEWYCAIAVHKRQAK